MIDIRILNRQNPDTNPTTDVQTPVVVVPNTLKDRYGSFQFIEWWDQARLKAASVMVVGAGALGNEVLKNLALLGIGRLVIVDFDRVEVGNLGRSMLFRASDSGRPKAEVAAEAVKSLNPEVDVLALTADVTCEVGLGLFRRMDVIIGCLDNREARLALNAIAYRLHKAWIDGAIQELLGVARVFAPGNAACYECTLSAADWDAINLRYSCSLLAREKLLRGKVATTPTIASIIGAIQAQEALKLLHGLEVQPGCGLIFNGLTNHSYRVTYPRREGCLQHDQPPLEIIELPSASATRTTIQEMLQIAQQHLGTDAYLELEFELVTGLYCANCNRTENLLLPLHRLRNHQTNCSSCGQALQISSTHRITGVESYLGRTMVELGIPGFHMILAFGRDRYIHFELTGDGAL